MNRLPTALLGAVVALLIVAIFGTPWSWNWQHWQWPWNNYDRAVTVKDFDRARGFDPDKSHAVCNVEKTSGVTAYSLTLNMGRGCRRAVELTVRREQIRPSVGRVASATFIYNRVVLFHDYAHDGVLDWRSPNSGGKKRAVKELTSLSLGDLLKVDLRHVNLRLPPQQYNALLH